MGCKNNSWGCLIIKRLFDGTTTDSVSDNMIVIIVIINLLRFRAHAEEISTDELLLRAIAISQSIGKPPFVHQRPCERCADDSVAMCKWNTSVVLCMGYHGYIIKRSRGVFILSGHDIHTSATPLEGISWCSWVVCCYNRLVSSITWSWKANWVRQ